MKLIMMSLLSIIGCTGVDRQCCGNQDLPPVCIVGTDGAPGSRHIKDRCNCNEDCACRVLDGRSDKKIWK